MSFSNKLYIYATSRAIRAKKEEYIKSNSFLPKMVTIADFESRAVASPYIMVDKMQRALFLKEASSAKAFDNLYIERSLVKFYTQSGDFFRFFEEIALESVDIKELYLADTYAEFDRDLELLEKLLSNYKEVLRENSLSDRVFLPKEYALNVEYIKSFDAIELELDGFLTKFEWQLFSEIAKLVPFTINIRNTPYNKKVQNELLELGIATKKEADVVVDLSAKRVLKQVENRVDLSSCEVVKCSEHLEQIAIAMAKIEQFVQSGMEPSKIALILPDESIAPVIDYFDRLNNFNFAMGKPYKREQSFIFLEQIQEYLKGSSLAYEYLKGVEFKLEKLKEIASTLSVDEFFNSLKELELPLYSSENFDKELDKLQLAKLYYQFNTIFKSYNFSFKEWLFLWISELSSHTLDDVGGGKVTVLGVLETRGLSFDGVVIIDFNEGVVPAISSKDRFLNSKVRAHASLPTMSDRESLQKHYYVKLLEGAKEAAIIYQESEEMMASKFLAELGLLNRVKEYRAPISLFYNQESRYLSNSYLDNRVVEFNPLNMVWSSSSLKSFLDCKRKFYYRYILKLQEPQSKEANEGIVLHNILSKVLNKSSHNSSFNEFKKAFLVELNSLEDSADLLYKKPLWSNLIDKLLKSQIEHFKQGWRVELIEHYTEGVIEGLRFKGRVDRVDKRDDNYLVIDYKSGKIDTINKVKADKTSDFQMPIYEYLLTKSANKIDFGYVEILTGKFDYLQDREAKADTLKEHIKQIKNIDSFEATRCDDLQKCRYCAYKLLCHRGEYL